MGLGLAIVRSLVEMHGGTVGVESAGEGQGSTFKITLPPPIPEEFPCEAPPMAEIGQAPVTPDSAPKLPGLRVLVVDDQVDMRDMLATILCLEEAEVRTADSLDEAMRIMTAWPPEIIVSDIAMPHASGYELIRRVRESGCNAPAIAITARASGESRPRVLAAGFRCTCPNQLSRMSWWRVSPV